MGLAGAASADPRAQIRGELDAELRTALVRAIGETDGPPTNGFDARRRARAAMASAEALLRSEGYYQPILADVVEGEGDPVAIVEITPGSTAAAVVVNGLLGGMLTHGMRHLMF